MTFRARRRALEAVDVGSARAFPKGHSTKLGSATVGGPYEVLKCCRAPPSRCLNATNFRIAENIRKAPMFHASRVRRQPRRRAQKLSHKY
jgi:hypothetical protein